MNKAKTGIVYVFLIESEIGTEVMRISHMDYNPEDSEMSRVRSAVEYLRKHRPFETYRILNITTEPLVRQQKAGA